MSFDGWLRSRFAGSAQTLLVYENRASLQLRQAAQLKGDVCPGCDREKRPHLPFCFDCSRLIPAATLGEFFELLRNSTFAGNPDRRLYASCFYDALQEFVAQAIAESQPCLWRWNVSTRATSPSSTRSPTARMYEVRSHPAHGQVALARTRWLAMPELPRRGPKSTHGRP
jgi:hypothetical protein